ncbi:hypothetical protein [Kosakonia pseudosacchari]|uniref:hypothetical protein n=1 Tax=Kosakonia pseudosacchari TaxID=1646340 RepID=UPI000A36337E|nr:hypothetical protein [Kosakonia pseudosacchari]
MKKYKVFSGVVLYFFLSAGAVTAEQEQNVIKIITCLLPGEEGKQVTLSINNLTKEISYGFKRAGKTELKVVFNEENKLKRFTDSQMGVIYYGFRLGEYGYIIDIINGSEKNEYTISFDIKKNNKVIQSSDCLPNSFRSDNIRSDYIDDVPNMNDRFFVFP